jgi:microcystin-dependent protein
LPDTNTTNLLMVEQTIGGNNNSWGTILNANFSKLDAKLGNRTSIATTGGDVTLTETQERVQAILVSGTLTSNVNIIFSGRGGSWIIRNATTGDYTVTCKISGQDGVVITQDTRQQVFFNGTDIQAGGASSAATSIPVGALQAYLGTTAPSGWVRANARTIGNAASGGTERANADTEDLYIHLWDTFSNTLLAIQDSAGVATTRGASGAADFAANKRLPLPDLRGRTFAGLDTMGNSAAGVIGTIITADTTVGATGGTETHTLVTGEMPAHTHTGPSHTHSVSASGTTGTESVTHTHSFSATTSSSGSHSHTPSGGGSFSLYGSSGAAPGGGSANPAGSAAATSTDGAHTHTVSGTSGVNSDLHTHSVTVTGTTGAEGTGATGSTGGGGAHSNMQPTMLGTWLLKL